MSAAPHLHGVLSAAAHPLGVLSATAHPLGVLSATAHPLGVLSAAALREHVLPMEAHRMFMQANAYRQCHHIEAYILDTLIPYSLQSNVCLLSILFCVCFQLLVTFH